MRCKNDRIDVERHQEQCRMDLERSKISSDDNTRCYQIHQHMGVLVRLQSSASTLKRDDRALCNDGAEG